MNIIYNCSCFLIVLQLIWIEKVLCIRTRLESASLIGGRETEPDEIKYLVSLQSEGEHICGGSIIGDRHILTAAHCLFNGSDEFDNKTITITAGTNDLTVEDLEYSNMEIEKIYVPSNYNDSLWLDSTPSGDIAVLKLKESLNLRYNGDLKKLRLPRINKRYKGNYKTYEGEDVVIAGFGWDKVKIKKARNKTEYEVGSSDDQLYVANAKVISNSECQESYSNPIGESDLCARVSEHKNDIPQGLCRGDSGGPLVYKENTIIGVVNGITLGCNENNEPGIYCRVTSYIGFIRNALKDVTDDMRVKILQ